MTVSPSVLSSSDELIVKSPNDRRSYRYIQLDNGLSALIVHDPEVYPDNDIRLHRRDDDNQENKGQSGEDETDDGSDEDGDAGEDDAEEENDDLDDLHSTEKHVQLKKAAAAMCVGMGSFSDPVEAQGLAHFLEHMLFMGSVDFPDENEYESYLSKHGGSSNAYTEFDHTCYHLEVKPEFFKGALRRFSQFFVAPLVKSEAMEREVLAVDSEFNQVLQDDGCRLQQLQCHTAPPGHPFNRFTWGNKESLFSAMEKGIDLREKVLKIFTENYHGGLMKLVIIGGETLDELESWVLEFFGNVKNGSTPQLNAEAGRVLKSPIWKGGKVYRLEAVKDIHTLDLSWTLPCLYAEYLKKPEDYFAHLLGHEGNGSLYYFFKTKGWATSLSAGVGDGGIYRSSFAFIFVISIKLTNSGLEKVFDIIGFVYQYIKILGNVSPQEWIFKELQDIGTMSFNFAEDQHPDDYAAELSENLFIYPPQHVIYGNYMYDALDYKLLKYILDCFIPENMRVDILSKSCDSADRHREPWFRSRYTEEDICPSLIDIWRNPSEVSELLHLPARNDFIPSDFSLRESIGSVNGEHSFSPVCIVEIPLMKIWYKHDKTFRIPRANAYFNISLKGSYDTAESCVLAELFIFLLKDELNEIAYQASVAMLETSVSFSHGIMEMKVFGFNDKLPVLLSKILSTVECFSPSEKRFKVIKEDLERNFRNANMKPLNHSFYSRLQILFECFWDVDEKLSFLRNLFISDMKAFIPQLLSKLYVEGLFHGNLLEEEAINMSKLFKDKFNAQPLPSEMRHEERTMCLPPGAKLVRDVPVKNKLETNSVTEVYFQIEQETGEECIKLRALIDLFGEIVTEPFFNQLRTKEQLGYVVSCSPKFTNGVFGFYFCVQSSQYSPVYLQERIVNFIDGFGDTLNGIDDVTFENYKSSLTTKLLEKHPTLAHETVRFWDQIVDKRYMFDMPQKEATALCPINRVDIYEWYKTYLMNSASSSKRRVLTVRVWGCNTHPEEAAAPSTSPQTTITDVSLFKSTSVFHQTPSSTFFMR